MKLKKVAVVYNQQISHSIEIKNKLKSLLDKYKIISDVFDIDSLQCGYDFVFVIGGDGTILKTSRYYAKYSIPIFGVNLGRLGFLSQSSADNIEFALKKILSGEYKTEDRIMLQYDGITALNDFVIKGSFTGRTSKFSLKINNKKVCDYLADGIIISTPTGSTAYGLSAGGPVIVPSLDAFVIVPICPHTLTARPLVVPDSELITICTGKSKDKYFLSADGQEFSEFHSEINIHKSQYTVKLALLDGTEFYSVLRDKLHWGTSPANI